MNWQEIINKSEFIYASTPEDIGFITWSLKKTICDVSYYEVYAIEDIDMIICSILNSHEGSLDEIRIATILGFNVVDDFDLTPKHYADKAELDIFRAIVKPLFEWGLLVKSDQNIFSLTKLGYRALLLGEKYKFYSAKKILFENYGIIPIDSYENLFFPYYSGLGLFSEITDSLTISYEKTDILEIFDVEESDLIKRQNLQSKDKKNIYKSETTNYYKIESCDVDIRLYKQGNEYFPIIFYNNQISVEATDLLYKSENTDLKDKKTEWGLYLNLIKNPNAVLDFNTIIPFEDLLDFDFLIKDPRLVWEDDRLFTFISENANANQWHSISNQCPITVIKNYLNKHIENWDWVSLSFRIDDDFLIKNATNYPWNFEVISGKEDISIEIVKTLFLIPELKEQDWDWDNIMPKLNFEFIKSNINRIDFELSELTKTNINAVQPLIIKYPDKKWNWSFISAEFELSYILDNLHFFSKYLNLKIVINRAFTSSEYVSLFCNNNYFNTLLIESKETILKDFSPNQAKYIWNTQLIEFFDRTNYLTWGSGTYTLGFECNPFIEWSYDFFKKYNSKISTDSGYSFVSRSVKNINIVLDNINFNWDWNAISTNIHLTANKEFVLSISDKLNFGLLLQNIDSETLELLFDKSEILSFLEQNPVIWLLATEIASIDFVRKHIDYNWDWCIITKRFCSSINIKTLGNPKWIKKWDWKYLTRNIDLSSVYANLDLYSTYWDWEYLTEILDKEFILDNLFKYNSHWIWKSLIVNRLDKSDLLFSSHLLDVATCISEIEEKIQNEIWQIITRKFDYVELKDQISTTCKNDLFHWDYAYFYNLPAFNLRNYLQNFSQYIHWKELSCCKKLNNELFFDKKLFNYSTWINDVFHILSISDYLWDFKEVSKIDNINWSDDVLQEYISLWDWEYLSLHSNCFKQDDKQIIRISKFQNYIDFSKFSARNDNSISEEVIQRFNKYEWNWQVLSKNLTIQYSANFLYKNKEKNWDWLAFSDRKIKNFNNEILVQLIDKSWDWYLISERKDIKFTIDLTEKLLNKPLNWETISTRTDIIFSEDFITLLIDKPLNWYIVSQSKSFIPNETSLSILKGKTLDWETISQNENLSIDCLWDYRENFNWTNITKHKIFEISDPELLSKYQDYIDWQFISNSKKFKPTFHNLSRFKGYLHWATINARKDFSISEEILEPFEDVLDWSEISQSMDISITEDLIEKYRNHWDWSYLRKNAQVIEKLNTTLKKYKSEFNCADFIENFHRKADIYHFTHLFNAIDIIKSRKILSRNKADGKFANAAGNLVDRRSTAHNFARFYFRTQTPTQFYNECLGWDASLITTYGKSYYQQARNLGLPKCPIPVFFKFDLKEVLMKMSNKCFYSTGNMQTDRARVIKITDNPNLLQTNNLFNNISDAFSMAGGPRNYDKQKHIRILEKIKEYSQQEFLVEEEFDFSELDTFEIICYDVEQAKLLKAQLGEDPICDKINSNSWSIFHKGNRELRISETDTEVSIFSEYRDNAYLSIQGEGLKSIQILNPEKIQKETASEIIAYPEIRFTKTDQPIEVHFVDLAIETRTWLIYKT